ncbi:MAG: AraC family transcriptional regulator [Gemmatimonadales bacterium]
MTAPTGPAPECGRIRLVHLSGFAISEFLLAGGFRSKRHGHELPGLVLPVSGALTVAGAFGARTIRPGEMLTLPADTAHSEHAAGVVACLLLEPTAEAHLDRLAPCRVIGHPDLVEATRRLSVSVACSLGAPEWEVTYEAVELLALASEPTNRKTCGRLIAARWVRRTAERLREEYSRPPSLADLARDAGVSREHLAREFRRAMGLTVGAYVRRQQMLEAVHLLQKSGISISQIALATGFTDQSHLCRRVRRDLGVTPGMIRSEGAHRGP